MKTTLWCLHGFLGQGADWNFLHKALPNVNLHCPDLFGESSLGGTFQEFATKFNSQVLHHGSKENYLLGYSLGGRLALHCVLQNPALYQKLIVVSAHPGLAQTAERAERLTLDQVWAKKLETQNAAEFLKDWNAQLVFSLNAANSTRDLHTLSHSKLKHALTEWSLGKQEDLSPKLKDLRIPILWITGEQDSKFSKLAQNPAHTPDNITHTAIPNAGHRVPWEKPEDFISYLNQFLFRSPAR